MEVWDRLYYYCCRQYADSEDEKRCVEEAKSILNGDFDVNFMGTRNRSTILSIACWFNCTEIIKLLLAHPDIEVNKQDPSGHAALHFSWKVDNFDAAILLLSDKRVNIEVRNHAGMSPFWIACMNNNHDMIEYMLINTDVDLTVKGDYYSTTSPMRKCTPLEVSYNVADGKDMKTAEMITEFEADREVARRKYKKIKGLGCHYDSAQLFLLVVLCSDGYFRIKESLFSGFFKILAELPLELQMIICNRVYETTTVKKFISSSLIELELRILRQMKFFV